MKGSNKVPNGYPYITIAESTENVYMSQGKTYILFALPTIKRKNINGS